MVMKMTKKRQIPCLLLDPGIPGFNLKVRMSVRLSETLLVRGGDGDVLHLMTKAWAAGGLSRRSRVAGGVRRKKRNHIPSSPP